jgi:ornithine cyclodeaminase/alanine dehydrogenase
VVVWSRTRATAERFAAAHSNAGIPIEVAGTAEAVVRAADVVCTLTPSREPYVRGDWFAPGLHLNAVGAPPRPDHREIDSHGLRRSVVVVDDLASALDRSGEVCIPIAQGEMTPGDIHGDLGQVITSARAGRTDDDEITLFNSVGLALQDVAAAQMIVARAKTARVGTDIDLHLTR